MNILRVSDPLKGPSHSTHTAARNKEPERRSIAADIDAFLAAGGQIESVPIGATNDKFKRLNRQQAKQAVMR